VSIISITLAYIADLLTPCHRGKLAVVVQDTTGALPEPLTDRKSMRLSSRSHWRTSPTC